MSQKIIENLDQQLWAKYQECYLRLQKAWKRKTGKFNEELSQTYEKTKTAFQKKHSGESVGESKKEQTGLGEVRNETGGLWTLKQKEFLPEKK
jgi:hypothetical protein